jgi:hypothetical protein
MRYGAATGLVALPSENSAADPVPKPLLAALYAPLRAFPGVGRVRDRGWAYGRFSRLRRSAKVRRGSGAPPHEDYPREFLWYFYL